MAIIRQARFPDDAAAILEIWREYIVSPSVSLDYQDNAAEFANLPGRYAPPEGCLILADRDGALVGCIALRKITPLICEMKRLYIRPTARSAGLGRRLVETLLIEARAAGYQEMRLDVLEEFAEARRLYEDLGFVPADRVSFNPLPGTTFMGLRLNSALTSESPAPAD